MLDSCSPVAVSAIDPVPAQIDHASRQPAARRAKFQVADAQSLPFADASFDVVASALVINFVRDRPRAISEMRRVARSRGIVAGYVWNLAEELSPSGPLRRGMRRFGVDVPELPGTVDSGLAALQTLFERAGFERIASRSIEVTLSYTGFDDFWQAQTPGYAPTTKVIASMSDSERTRLQETVRALLPARADGGVEYSARANAIKAYVPG